MAAQKEINLTFVRLVNKKAELNKRNAKAQEYIDSVAQRRATKHRLFKKGSVTTETLITIASLLCVLILTAGIFAKAVNTEPRYAIASEQQADGNHFIYVTERVCTVTEIKNNLITVECKGNLYSFYGNGYKVGTEIVCLFTDNWEIVDAYQEEDNGK